MVFYFLVFFWLPNPVFDLTSQPSVSPDFISAVSIKCAVSHSSLEVGASTYKAEVVVGTWSDRLPHAHRLHEYHAVAIRSFVGGAFEIRAGRQPVKSAS